MGLRKALFSPSLWLKFDCPVALHPYPSICPWKLGPLPSPGCCPLSAVGNAQVPVSFPVKEFMGEGSRCASAEDVIAVYLVS